MYQRIRSWKLTTIILILLLAQLGLGWIAWRGESDASVTQLPTVSSSSNDVGMPSSLESLYTVAAARANEWRDDAQLMTASLQVDWPFDPISQDVPDVPGGGWASFAFYSLGDDDPEVLSMLMERYSGAIVQEAVVSWLGDDLDPKMIDFATTGTESLTALVAAELTSGQTFRLACPERRHETHVSLTWTETDLQPSVPVPNLATPVMEATPVVATPVVLPAATPEAQTQPIWIVSYEDTTEPGRYPLRVTVDANSGQVVAVQGGDPRC